MPKDVSSHKVFCFYGGDGACGVDDAVSAHMPIAIGHVASQNKRNMLPSSNEQRLVFPSWSNNGSSLSLSRTRRGRNQRLRGFASRVVQCASLFAVALALLAVFNHHVRHVLISTALCVFTPWIWWPPILQINQRDLAMLGVDNNLAITRQLSNANPWRSHARISLMLLSKPRPQASRRPLLYVSLDGKGTLIPPVSGCGGTFRQSAQVGDVVSLRYVVRPDRVTGHGADRRRVLDASGGEGRDTVDVQVGSGQVEASIERAMVGVCQGDLIQARFGGTSMQSSGATLHDSDSIAVNTTSRGTEQGAMVLIGYVVRVKATRRTAWSAEHQAEQADQAELDELDELSRRVEIRTGRVGASCASVCGRHGLTCDERALVVVNNCPRLREAFECVTCEVATVGAAGRDMPAWVSLTAPRGHARGACLVAPTSVRPGCASRYRHTRRLCGCV